MRTVLGVLLPLVLVPAALAQKPKEYAGIVSGQPAVFRAFVAENDGKLVRLQLYFDAEPKDGKTKAKAVYEPYGYKGDGDLALFNVGDRTYWLSGGPRNQSWRKAPYWEARNRAVVGVFRVAKNRRAGGGRWFDLTYVRPAGPPNVPKHPDPDGPR